MANVELIKNKIISIYTRMGNTDFTVQGLLVKTNNRSCELVNCNFSLIKIGNRYVYFEIYETPFNKGKTIDSIMGDGLSDELYAKPYLKDIFDIVINPKEYLNEFSNPIELNNKVLLESSTAMLVFSKNLSLKEITYKDFISSNDSVIKKKLQLSWFTPLDG